MSERGQLSWHGLPIDGMTREQLVVVVYRLMVLPSSGEARSSSPAWRSWMTDPPSTGYEVVEIKRGFDSLDIGRTRPNDIPSFCNVYDLYWRPIP